MNRLFIRSLLGALTRALLVHCFGEVFQMIFHYLAPDVSQLARIAIGLVLAAIIIEVAAIHWQGMRK